MNIIIPLLFLFNLLFLKIYTYIVLPFQNTDLFEEDFPIKDINNFLEDMSKIYLYSELYLGNPPQKIIAFFESDLFDFQIMDVISPRSNFEGYEPSESETFSAIVKEENSDSYSLSYCYANDSFYLLENEGDISKIYSKKNINLIDANKYKEFKGIRFLFLKESSSDHSSIATIGLASKNSVDNYFKLNFFDELKRLNYIVHPIWSIHFIEDKSYSGNFIIGGYPHEYDSNNYYKDQFVKYRIKERTQGKWIIKANNFCLHFKNTNNNTEIDKDIDKIELPFLKRFSLELNIYFMHAPYELYNILKIYYFKKYFEDYKCNYKIIKKNKKFIYCDKKNFKEEDMQKFPSIYFYVKEYDYTFEIDYYDVFEEKGDYIIFKIIFENNLTDYIRLGQSFMYNFKFTFNFMKSEIGFYKTGTLQNIRYFVKFGKLLTFRNLFLLIFIIIIFAVVTFWIWFFFKNRKKIIDIATASQNIINLKEEDINQGYELKIIEKEK